MTDRERGGRGGERGEKGERRRGVERVRRKEKEREGDRKIERMNTRQDIVGYPVITTL